MSEPLVGADRRSPDASLPRVAGRRIERITPDAGRDRSTHEAFGVQAREDLAETCAYLAEQLVCSDGHFVEEEGELALRSADLHFDGRRGQAGRLGVDDEQREDRPTGRLVGPGSRHNEYRTSLVEPGDEVLGA